MIPLAAEFCFFLGSEVTTDQGVLDGLDVLHGLVLASPLTSKNHVGEPKTAR